MQNSAKMFSIKSLEINIKRLNEFQTFTFHMNVRPPNFERQISSKIAFVASVTSNNSYRLNHI